MGGLDNERLRRYFVYMQSSTGNRDTLVRVPADLHRRVKIRAAKEGLSLREIMKRLLEQWLSRKAA
jgi:predicted DNA binding CopG/RHH family protein